MKTLILSMVVAALCVTYADTYDETTGFVTLEKSDAASPVQTSLSTAGNWSDGLPPHDDPATNYYVGAGLELRGPEGAASSGGSFMFPAPLYVAGTVRCRGRNTAEGTFSDLYILPNGAIGYYETGALKGRITFLSEDAANPSFIRYMRNDNGYAVRLLAKIVGSERSKVKFEGTSGDVKPSWITDESGADWTEFKGTLSFANGFGTQATKRGINTPGTFAHGNNALLLVNASKDCSFGGLSFVGDSIVTNYAKVDVSGVLNTGANMNWQSREGQRVSTVGTFVIGNGSSFLFHKAASYTSIETFSVTNRLLVGTGVSMSFTLDAISGSTPAEYTVFKLSPEAVEAGLPDFSSISASMNAFVGALPGAYIAVKDDPDVEGGKIAYLTHKQIVEYIGPDQSSEANHTMDTDVDQTGVWSNGGFPDAGFDYYVPKGKTIAFRAPNEAHPNRVTSFPGDRLILNDLSTVRLHDSAHIPSLHLYARSVVYPRASCSLSGKLSVHYYTAKTVASVQMLGSLSFNLNSEVDGDGDLIAQSYYPASGVGASLYLGGINTNWTGGIRTAWTKQNASDPDSSETAHVRIVVGDGRNLGGALSEFRYDSLKLDSYAELRVTNTTTFAESTRGFLIETNGCLNVDEGAVASLCAPITLDGTLRKTGGGILSLGGPLRFGRNSDPDDTTAPTEGNNVIIVKAGAIKAANSKALNGAVLDFAAGTSLRLDLHPADAAMQSKGFVFTDAKSSLSYDGRLFVVFEGGSDDDFKRDITVPLCTVATGDAETIKAKLNPRMALDRGSRSGVLSSVENGDVTSTIFASFKARGFTLIYR